MSNFEITKTIEIDSSKDRVYDALINSDEILRYFPLEQVVSTWKVGDPIKYIGGQSGVDEGIIDVLDKNKCFQFTYWNANHGTENKKENHITITYSLSGEKSHTILTLKQSNIPSERYLEIMNSVWDDLLYRLKQYAESSA